MSTRSRAGRSLAQQPLALAPPGRAVAQRPVGTARYGKRSHADRCRFLDIARGSALECAASLDIVVARKRLAESTALEGKAMLVRI